MLFPVSARNTSFKVGRARLTEIISLLNPLMSAGMNSSPLSTVSETTPPPSQTLAQILLSDSAGDDASGPEAERVGPSAADSRHRPAGCDTCDVDNPASSKAQPPPAASFSWPKGVRGALSISFDDARESQVDHRSAALFKERGIRVTYFVSLTNVERKQDLWRRLFPTSNHGDER